jgi:hypothetical protein
MDLGTEHPIERSTPMRKSCFIASPLRDLTGAIEAETEIQRFPKAHSSNALGGLIPAIPGS